MAHELSFASDYTAGAHPAVLARLLETNLEHTSGYGEDVYSQAARQKIRKACACPAAGVHFFVGGTQTNATVIGTLLAPYQGVIAARSGHISTHEAGAIELGGHKVLCLPHEDGKLTAAAVAECLRVYREDENRDHMVMPGAVYLSQPSEYGTLYTLAELEALASVCRQGGLKLYVDGARLAYALACPQNDVSLADLARLCDAFYIGGTKCGALFGEALVLPRAQLLPHFFTVMKQNGAVLAKGRLLGLQFDALFTGDLYRELGRTAIAAADTLRAGLAARGRQTLFGSPTNQIFLALSQEEYGRLSRQAGLSFFEKRTDGRIVARICTSWATTPQEIESLLALL